jgi:iron complex outermembrane receptor protein
MKRGLFLTLLMIVALSVFFPIAWAQENDTEEFMLEEIVVTAEKREVAIQEIPSSVSVIEGAALKQQGKVTTRQILESIPNVVLEQTFSNASVMAGTPDANVSIRGVRFKQTSDGQPPAATAVYVDGIFQGIGGSYDVNRVEVLRGPQGTLYGRSATGGVVSFHTNDPELDAFGGNASAEIGEANLRNYQAAINVPYGDEFAIRLAWHDARKDGYYNEDGGKTRTSEGRAKALWAPTDAFDIMLTAALTDRQNNSGGSEARLIAPTTIDYDDTVSDVMTSGTQRSTMYALTANYDFGPSILTYIASYRHYEDLDSPYTIDIRTGSQIMHNQFVNYGENFRTHELRLASDTEGWLTWLVGANHYNSDYDRYQNSVNHIAYADGEVDPDPATQDAPIFEQPANGEIKNFGIFTEETFDITDEFRITAGLRYDNTEIYGYSAFNMNVNENENRNALNPASWAFYGLEDTLKYDNVTYKLRFEYDLTPDSMLYALTATGFQPGDVRITNTMSASGVEFSSLPYDEEKLTSYEIGIKNRFLENRLQVNLGAFYYDYDNYRHTVNYAVDGPPEYTIMTTPLEMKGAELAVDWLLTANDMLALTAGWLDAQITGYPDMILNGEPAEYYLAMEDVPNVPDLTATLSYDHTFLLPNGSTLAPRAEIKYTDGYYLGDNLTQDQIEAGVKPYIWQDSYFVTDIGTTWTSTNNLLSVTAYVRNLFDEEYKAAVEVSGGTEAVGVTAGDPQAWGLVLNVQY